MKCELCKQNPACVIVDQLVNGSREKRYVCRACVDKLKDEKEDRFRTRQ